MGKLSAFWLTTIAASLGASAASAAVANKQFDSPPTNARVMTVADHAQARVNASALFRAQSQVPHVSLNTAAVAGPGLHKLDAALLRIASASATTSKVGLLASLRNSFPKGHFSQNVPYAAPLVGVEISVKGDPNSVRQQLLGMGIFHATVAGHLISSSIPADRLAEVSSLDGVGAMYLSMSRLNTGSVTAQGDIIQSSYALRLPYNTPGYTGAGYTVGVISDSFDCGNALTTMAQDIATGDLPNDPNIIVKEDPDCTSGTDEGRAMAQLVYDIAPGAAIRFYSADAAASEYDTNAIAGEADFAAGILALANDGAKIIVDDVSYFHEPVFMDGVIAQAVDTVHGNGVAYFSSAGNDARQSYEASWIDSGIQGVSDPSDNGGQELMAFKTPAGAPVPPFILPVLMPYAGNLSITLQWDQPFVSEATAENAGATSSMKICVVDLQSGQVIPGFCSAANTIGQDPYVQVDVVNNPVDPNNPAIEFGLEISLAAGTPPNQLKLSFLDDGLGSNPLPGWATYSPTIMGHAAAAGAAAVGASYFRANPLCNPSIFPTFALEPYSSSGGDPILFSTDGNRLVTKQIRQKPQFVAPDGDNTTFFSGQLGQRVSSVPGCANAANSYNFFGTSSAAPHAAGMAALLWEAGPDQTNDMVVSAMEHSAVMQMLSGDWATYNPLAPISEPTNPVYVLQNSVNYDTGWGFIQGYYALPYVVLQANPGTALFVPQGNTVTLDGSGSSIPTGSTPTYTWTQVSGPAVTLSNASTAHPSFPATETGTYAFVLTVALDNGRVSATSAPVAVTVTGGPGPGGSSGGAVGLGLLVPGLMAAALRRRRKV